ncbi:Hypp8709 [Branchiostoma lanceolatum]|uniref:Hypp8709 protein n=1 Tax=Branchiostoma lanceolatum TaxID=7740 RepID=A0A8K0EFN9_BRALA|nr:Hypp8709 [Branchiostoma lanceolatum]
MGLFGGKLRQDRKMASGEPPRNFSSWTVPNLSKFLRDRQVPVANARKDELVRNCIAADQLGLLPNPNIAGDNVNCRRRKLTLDGGVIRLPDPDELKTGWEDSPASFPNLVQDSVERYLDEKNRAIDISTGGRESLRDGKSLYVSGHIGSVQYHGVGGNIPYCFMRSVCIRETSLREVPYKLWIIIHKEKQVLVESFCTCPAGLRGTCKHVSALCHYIIAIAARGANTAVTEQRQTWNAPPKNLHPPEFMHNINIRKVQGNCVIENEERRPKRFKYDPRAPNDRGERSIYQLDMDGLRDATNGAAGILTYFPGVPDNQEPCMADLSVVLEEIVEHEPVACLPPL